MRVLFEIYGVARLRAGRDMVGVEGETIAEALASLERACPALSGTVIEKGRLGRHYLLSLNGRSFVADPELRLADGDRLILMAAEGGG